MVSVLVATQKNSFKINTDKTKILEHIKSRIRMLNLWRTSQLLANNWEQIQVFKTTDKGK